MTARLLALAYVRLRSRDHAEARELYTLAMVSVVADALACIAEGRLKEGALWLACSQELSHLIRSLPCN